MGNWGYQQKTDPTASSDRAEADLNASIQRNAKNSPAYQYRAELNYSRALCAQDPLPYWERAVADYSRYLEFPGLARKRYFEILFWRGRCLYLWSADVAVRKGDPRPTLDKAVADFGRVLEQDPANASALFWRGRACVEWGFELKRRKEDARAKFEMAVVDLSKILAANPKDVRALNWRGLAHYYAERWKEALADLETVAEADPANRKKLQPIIDECRRRL